jgi:hypothetical protein
MRHNFQPACWRSKTGRPTRWSSRRRAIAAGGVTDIAIAETCIIAVGGVTTPGIAITGIGAIGICTIATGVIAMLGGSVITAIGITITVRITGRTRVRTTAPMSIASDCAGGERAALTLEKRKRQDGSSGVLFRRMDFSRRRLVVRLRRYLSRRWRL